MKTILSPVAFFSGVILSAGFLSNVYAAGFNDLRSHRAVYEVKLENAEDRSGIVGAQGRIVFKSEGNACEGISTDYRFVLNLKTARDSFVTDQQTALYESADGNEFNFSTRSFVNEQPDQVVAGFARRENDALLVSRTGKEQKDLELENAIFVSTQLVEILEAAKAGNQFISHDIFDGVGDADEVFRTSTIIGKPKEIESAFEGENPDELESFEGRKAWPVTISYFEKDIGNSAESIPHYEVSYMLYDDGIIRNLLMRFSDYALIGALSDIEFIETTPCD